MYVTTGARGNVYLSWLNSALLPLLRALLPLSSLHHFVLSFPLSAEVSYQRLPCIQHQSFPAEAGTFSWSRSWIVLPAASRCVCCAPGSVPFVCAACSGTLLWWWFWWFFSGVSWTRQNKLVVCAGLVKLTTSGLLIESLGRDHERCSWAQSYHQLPGQELLSSDVSTGTSCPLCWRRSIRIPQEQHHVILKHWDNV